MSIYINPWLLDGAKVVHSFCPGLVVQFGSIVGLFAVVLVRLIFPNCFSAYHGRNLEDSKKVPVWLRFYVVSLAYGRSTSTSSCWFGSSSSLILGFLLVGLRCWWCSAIVPQGCYVGSDLWRLGFLLRFSSLLSKFRLRTSEPILHLYWRS